MQKKILFAGFSLLIAAVTACSPTPAAVPPMPTAAAASSTPEVVENAAPTALPTQRPNNTPTALSPEAVQNIFPYQHYFIKAELQYLAHTVSIEQTVSFTNYTETDLNEITLVVPAQQIPEVFSLKALSWENGSPVLGYQLRQGLLTIPFSQTLKPDDSTAFYLQYELNLPTANGSFGYTEDQILMDNWYAFIPPFSPDEGWMIHQPSEVGEYLVYPVSSFEVSIFTDDPTVQIAAPGRRSSLKEGMHFILPRARRFAFAASPEFIVSEAVSGEFSAELYSFDEDHQHANKVLEPCLQSMELFSELFGQSPTRRLVIVEAQFQDALESDGLFFLGEEYFDYPLQTPEDWITIISAHEVSHLWWYSLLGTDPAESPWLDEAFAAYSELLYLENYYPGSVNWWWEFRMGEYIPGGNLSMTVYDTGDRWDYINDVYLQGVLLLHDLRMELGDPVFFDMLTQMTAFDPVKIFSPEDFFDLLSPYANPSVQSILQEYFPGIE